MSPPRWAHQRLGAGIPVALLLALTVPFPGGPAFAAARWVEGTVSLAPRQAKVVSKFCFDFNKACPNTDRCDGAQPGHLWFNLTKGRLPDGGAGVQLGKPSKDPVVHVALLDDEYFSFPEISQVWDELNCTDVLKAAKRTFPLSWKELTRPIGETVQSFLIERLRPRWWYIAFVSCSPSPVELHYDAHFVNRLQGARQELSMDEPGMHEAMLLLVAIGAVAALHFQSRRRWREDHGGGPEALKLLSVAVLFGTAAAGCWLRYYWGCHGGRCDPTWLVVARTCGAVTRTLMSMLLLLMAHGESVCKPGIAWTEHWELVLGIAVFGGLSLLLEMYGDSQVQTTTTEYIYDTRLGTAMVAFDLFYLWVYVSRSWRSFQAETRAKQRIFYKHYAPMFALWFAALPAIACLAGVVAPWYRYYVVFLVSGLAQAVTLGALVWTFSPGVAPRLYLVDAAVASGRHERAMNDEELEGMLNGDTDI